MLSLNYALSNTDSIFACILNILSKTWYQNHDSQINISNITRKILKALKYQPLGLEM
jgi:hypothetical protein